jgi:hypothetical protein
LTGQGRNQDGRVQAQLNKVVVAGKRIKGSGLRTDTLEYSAQLVERLWQNHSATVDVTSRREGKVAWLLGLVTSPHGFPSSRGTVVFIWFLEFSFVCLRRCYCVIANYQEMLRLFVCATVAFTLRAVADAMRRRTKKKKRLLMCMDGGPNVCCRRPVCKFEVRERDWSGIQS